MARKRIVQHEQNTHNLFDTCRVIYARKNAFAHRYSHSASFSSQSRGFRHFMLCITLYIRLCIESAVTTCQAATWTGSNRVEALRRLDSFLSTFVLCFVCDGLQGHFERLSLRTIDLSTERLETLFSRVYLRILSAHAVGVV